MFSRGLGGIEQAFIDYTEALEQVGHFVAMITHPSAAINAKARMLNASHISLRNLGGWDPVAAYRLGVMLRTLRADAVIAHGNRAITLASKGLHSSGIPLVAVGHNYHFQHLAEADAVFAITRHMQTEITEQTGIAPNRIYHMPNMIRIGTKPFRSEWSAVPVIAAMGRFVEKKGFDVLLRALCNLHQRGFAFRAVIAGSGQEEQTLKSMAAKLEIAHLVEFPGWVDNPARFMENSDIFVLPSHHEPFGIVLLEAMRAAMPIVTTDAEGPVEIIRHQETGLICPKAQPVAMAEALSTLLANQDYARTLGENAHATAEHYFAIDKAAMRMQEALRDIIKGGAA